jgi:hypothetical protein
LPKKGAMPYFFENLLTTLDESFPKTYDKPLFVVIENNSVPIRKIMTLGSVNEEI